MIIVETYKGKISANDGGESSFRIEIGSCQLCNTDGIVLAFHYASEIDGDDCSDGLCRKCLSHILNHLKSSQFCNADNIQ